MKLSLDINTDFEVTTLTDLPKLKIVMENLNMKINKSEIARHMDVDRRTVDKYLNGFEPTKKRNRQSIIDKYYPIIEKLLSDTSEQKFYYKRILW
ncbi:TPA: IS21 family transposase, partial [Staphylococcus aureus]